METSSDFANAFQALSVILVFVTVLFGIKYPQFSSDIDIKSMPNANLVVALNNYREKLRNNLIRNLIPILAVDCICSYLVMPTTYKIIITSTFNLIDFDFLKTAFVLVSGLICFFTLHAFYIGYRYIAIIKTKPKP